ncbi:MAG: bifunctional 2-C-methyl-D-erythritol 4-phosphate cytidylyltransferase/2-C-methyl-D-erythritol 2,4-cyclodiphosphate synthase [Alphaproteobacteria bacterium]|nr:bifunctional 2-C-methyl-D-erythritol 4-phosphate cytidylyltransferase/2-C-methyl-D-erythritol 2,4-cyclodiphosphate synthase [Alphaproteobacteria bacterium]
MRTVALVVAAGRGARLGGEVPKQYLPLAGRPILRHSLETFCAHPAIAATAVVIQPDDHAQYLDACRGLDLLPPIAGGSTRQESVRRGLESLAPHRPDLVLIHDAARPLVGAGIVTRIIEALRNQPGAIAAVPVRDTLKRGNDGLVSETVDRACLWRAQTPQGFRYSDIVRAHAVTARREFTDDAQVAEAAGLSVTIVEDSEDNLKITTEADIGRAERILSAATADVRVGSGFDVHRFAPGDTLMLCGVRVPFDRSLEGHSDADVGLHALCDALFATISAGDIGAHFPPGDLAWRGADSSAFVTYAVNKIRGAGGIVAHVDVTLICEAPKIAPHREAMVARIATLLGIARDRVSIKATTTDGLGFTGRREGIAAQATATVRLPLTPPP